MIRGHADALIDRFLDRRECEFVSEFADLLPAMVILTLFGLSLDNLDRAVTWGRYQGFGIPWSSDEVREQATSAIADLSGFLRERILECQAEPRDDDLSRYVQAHIAWRGELDIANVIADAFGLMIGGILTTNTYFRR